MHGEGNNSSCEKLVSLGSKKQALLNKFLSKTYHMIDKCEPSIASWCADGKAFLIKDVDEFAKTVLPRYFNHSKFASFVRQLNFYSFRKIRSSKSPSSSSSSSQSKTVKFSHPFFRKDHPELLHKIQRITKSQDVSSGDIKSLKEDVAEMNEQLLNLSCRLDKTIQGMTSAVESDYQQRLNNIALSYKSLSDLAMKMYSTNNGSNVITPIPSSSPVLSSPSPHDSSIIQGDVMLPDSPRSTAVSSLDPLMTLSGVASMICEGMGN